MILVEIVQSAGKLSIIIFNSLKIRIRCLPHNVFIFMFLIHLKDFKDFMIWGAPQRLHVRYPYKKDKNIVQSFWKVTEKEYASNGWRIR